MINYKNEVHKILKKVLKETSNVKIDVNKNIKLINNTKIDSLALVTFFSMLDKKVKSKKNLLLKYDRFKDTDELIKFLDQNEKL